MADAYGNAFTSQYGEEPNPSWAAGLAPFADDQIREGYTRAIFDNREFPPNLSTLIGYINESNAAPHQHLQGRSLSQIEDQKREEIERFERLTGQRVSHSPIGAIE